MIRIRSLPSLAGLAAVFLVTGAFSQGPLSEKVTVTFSTPVLVGDTKLTPGEYTIRRIQSASNPHILEFSSQDGTQVEATITAIPVLDNRNTKPTRVLLEQRGADQFVKQVWIQGVSYGYELTPGSMTGMSATSSFSSGARLTGTYTPAETSRPSSSTETARPSPDSAQAEQPRTEPREQPAVAQSDPPPQETPAPQATAPVQPEQPAQPAQPDQSASRDEQQSSAQDRNLSAAAQQPPDRPAATPAPADTPSQDAPQTLPATAANWLGFVIGGAAFMAAGTGMLVGKDKRNRR